MRKKWIVLTPEEWVRQHLINYLIENKGVPKSLISVEKEINLNGLKKRYDLVVYNTQLKPLLLAECKAPEISITESTAEQALRYNLIMGVPFLLLTNGLTEMVFDLSYSVAQILYELPLFNKISNHNR